MAIRPPGKGARKSNRFTPLTPSPSYSAKKAGSGVGCVAVSTLRVHALAHADTLSRRIWTQIPPPFTDRNSSSTFET